ncbi:MAG: hypothetical protein OXN90_16770 [Gemmatimonadota bacterium]|nr:hypothetical protein [Gemmatimonadota bacterium]
MKKSRTDHALAIGKAALAAVPHVGGSIAILLDEYVPSATERSIQRALEHFGNRLEQLEKRIDFDAVNKDDFAELFKSCYLSIVRSHREEKLKAAAAILANLFLREDDPDKLSYTELDHYSRCLETLSSGAVEVLGVIVQEAHSGRHLLGVQELDWTIESYHMNFSEIHLKLQKYSPDLLMGLVAELNKANLLNRESASGVQMDDYSHYSIRLTALGTRFCRFLIE